MHEPLLSLHVSCVNLGLQLALFFLQAIRSEQHKVVVQTSQPSGPDVCLLTLCVYRRERERQGQRESREERERKKNVIQFYLSRKTETELTQERNITILMSGSSLHCAVQQNSHYPAISFGLIPHLRNIYPSFSALHYKATLHIHTHTHKYIKSDD